MRRFLNWVKWLYPGMRVKRWLLLTVVGIALVVVGLALLTNLSTLEFFNWLNQVADEAYTNFHITIKPYSMSIGGGIAVLGLLVIFVSFWQVNRSIIGALLPDSGGLRTGDIANRVYQRRSLAQGQRIVVIGGGTGLSTMLRGLKQHTSNLAAIVTVTDNGGSSGLLTESTGILPPGDLRNCMVALADEEPTLARAFNFRFNGQHPSGLHGHSLGNLFIAAMTELNDGNYEKAIADASKILAIRGKVYPSTLTSVTLIGEMVDGECIEGEIQIAHSGKKIERIWLRPESARPLDESLAAIKHADAIILGPGSVFTSVAPNLLVDGIAEAIDRARAVKIYVCNVMTQPGETDGYTASDHVCALAAHAPGQRLFDYVLVNRQRPDPALLAKYAGVGQEFVEPDVDKIRALGYTPILGDYISETNVVRHNADALADAIFRVII
ncbi:MAG: YvcK family protein [Capsulimonadaceae bacterium]|nr:YvcK family protein [Capsulimonadaceae bacterium]